VSSDKIKMKMRNAKLGKKQSSEHIEKRINRLKGKKRKPFSEETKEKMRLAAKNKQKMECEYCHIILVPYNYSKYHGEKCKLK